MTTDVTYPHIEKPAGEPARLSRLPRIRVTQIVMDYLAHGWSPDEICRQHIELHPAEVHSAMAYYFDHQTEIDGEIRQEVTAVDQARQNSTPSSLVMRLRAQGRI